MTVEIIKKKEVGIRNKDIESSNENLLIELNDYLASGIHIGMKFKTGFMKKYTFKTREDGLNVLNISQINDRLKIAAKMLSNYEPSEILIIGKRDSAKKPISLFSKLTGIRAVVGRYYPGTITNPSLKIFSEAKLILVADQWSDRNAIKDAYNSNIPIIALCDTNNTTQKIDFVIPCNNKGKKSLATIFYILTKEYLKEKKKLKTDKEFDYEINDFIDKTKEKKPKKKEYNKPRTYNNRRN